MEEIRIDFCHDVEKAARFVAAVSDFREDVDLLYGRYVLDAKSLVSVLSVLNGDLVYEMRVKIVTDDPATINRFMEKMEEFIED